MAHTQYPPRTPHVGVLYPPAKCGCFRGPFSFGSNTSALLSSQAGEKHYHPLCALCVRCGRMFAEGEEMYLQGKDKMPLPSPLGQDRDIPWACPTCWVGPGGWPVSPRSLGSPPPSPVAARGTQSHGTW